MGGWTLGWAVDSGLGVTWTPSQGGIGFIPVSANMALGGDDGADGAVIWHGLRG
jgi:hypothetical protein